ncbi:hypothetical protein [Pseudonocardia sp.]|uniref:hypothetical protein n=1 Tax=Pseudonocardia sp. TaxID=60912 RepID=UPI003D0FD989
MPTRHARHPWTRTGVLAALLVVLATLGLIGIDRAGGVAPPHGPAGSALQVERPIGHVAFASVQAGKRPVVADQHAPGGHEGHPAVTVAQTDGVLPRCGWSVVAGHPAATGRESGHGGWRGRAPPVSSAGYPA